MDEKLFENFVFIGIPRDASEVSGIGPGTVVKCTECFYLLRNRKNPRKVSAFVPNVLRKCSRKARTAMNKILKVLGKKGCVIIPFEIRKSLGYNYNDVISFTPLKDGSILFKKRGNLRQLQ